MDADRHAAGLIALLRADEGLWGEALDLVMRAGGVDAALDAHLGLLAGEAYAEAERELAAWRSEGIDLLSPLSDRYPTLLRGASSPPPLLFVAGALAPGDDRAVAVIGSREATPRGIAAARAVTRRLLDDGHTIVSGLAAGIDATAHRAALDLAGRTLAVTGCGLRRCYPPQHASLQRRIAERGAVVSQFWPEQEPTRQTFPMRNALMAALTNATVIIEASETSGTRIQARSALAEGRQVLLLAPVMERAWARELATRPGVTVVSTPGEVSEALARPVPDGSAP